MFKRIAMTIALAVAPATFAQTYIVPGGDCGAVTFNVTRGGDFPKLGQAIDVDQVTDAYLYVPKQRIAVKLINGEFDANVPGDAVVMASVNLEPEINGDETRTEHAKAFIFCGDKTPAADWQRSAGLGLEIYPQGWNGPRPQMKTGDTMRFIAVDETTKKLIGDLPMELYRAGAGRIAEGVPAQHSGMNFPYPEPGWYMVVAKYRRPDPKQPNHWLVDTSTLTFEVK